MDSWTREISSFLVVSIISDFSSTTSNFDWNFAIFFKRPASEPMFLRAYEARNSSSSPSTSSEYF